MSFKLAGLLRFVSTSALALGSAFAVTSEATASPSKLTIQNSQTSVQEVRARANQNRLVAQNGCTQTKSDLQWVGYGYTIFQRRADNAVFHVQKNVVNRAYTALIYSNFRYLGQYRIPLDIAPGLVLRFENRIVLETWMGRVRQVIKVLPVAVYCSNLWTRYEAAQNNAARDGAAQRDAVQNKGDRLRKIQQVERRNNRNVYPRTRLSK